MAKAGHLLLGECGENLAENFLAARGLRIIERRVRSARGEIDLVAKNGGEWVFIEVKTRKGGGSGSAAESFTPAKAGRMRAAVTQYILNHGLSEESIRCDFLAIDIAPDGTPEFNYYPGGIAWSY